MQMSVPACKIVGRSCFKTAKLASLKKRTDFLRLARGPYRAMPAFILQCQQQPEHISGNDLRVGYTASKKVGNAVMRNRAKRRLRVLAAAILPLHGAGAYDYVLIARKGTTIHYDHEQMQQDLIKAVRKIHTQFGDKGQ